VPPPEIAGKSRRGKTPRARGQEAGQVRYC
jgi:hypothetical protein